MFNSCISVQPLFWTDYLDSIFVFESEASQEAKTLRYGRGNEKEGKKRKRRGKEKGQGEMLRVQSNL